MELAVDDANLAGGIDGEALELLVQDTAADPGKAEAAVDDLVQSGVKALAGEYHSVAARAAAARAEARGIAFLCSSAVLDKLTDGPSDWVARLCPAQSLSWEIYADFLMASGHRRIAVVTQPSVYWAAGVDILRNLFRRVKGELIELDGRDPATSALCDRIVASEATALLLLVGYPQPASSIVMAARGDPRFKQLLIGAPAGQPEFPDWAAALGDQGMAIPFLRYRRDSLSPLGTQVEMLLRARLGVAPSFVALEGYDSIIVLAEALRSTMANGVLGAGFWSRVSAEGTRGQIQFSRPPGMNVWQWQWAPVEVVQRKPPHLDPPIVLYRRQD